MRLRLDGRKQRIILDPRKYRYLCSNNVRGRVVKGSNTAMRHIANSAVRIRSRPHAFIFGADSGCSLKFNPEERGCHHAFHSRGDYSESGRSHNSPDLDIAPNTAPTSVGASLSNILRLYQAVGIVTFYFTVSARSSL